MPRRRVTLGLKKSKKKRAGNPDTPSHEEFLSMTEFGSFVVRDEDDIEHTFRKGDAATVLPHGCKVGEDLELYNYWVVRIKEIRARDGDEVWARVQWYWSGAEVATTIKSFDGLACGRYERIFSDHYDYVSSSAFDAVVRVKMLDDDDIEQPDIGPEDFYTRYTFEYQARVISPKPGCNSCICKQPYRPDDTTTVMHFCPRPNCRRFFHQTCLVKTKSRDPDDLSTRPLRLLTSSPDSDDTVSLESLSPDAMKKKRRGRPLAKSQNIPEFSAEELLSKLPQNLVLVAEQSIVRGAPFKAGGVAGNINAVIRARRLVYAAVAGTPVPEDWEDTICAETAVVKMTGRKLLPPLICPYCQGAI